MGPKGPTEKRWIRIGVVARAWGVHAGTAKRIARAVEIPTRRFPGCSHTYYDRLALERVAKESTQPAGA